MTKKQMQAAAKKELKRVKGLDMTCHWSIEGLENIDVSPMRRTSDAVYAEDIDDAPMTGDQMCRQLADNVMRSFVRTAMNEYMRHLQNIADTGTTNLHSSD